MSVSSICSPPSSPGRACSNDDCRLVGVVSIVDAIDDISAQLGGIADAMRFGLRTEVKVRP
ncbi:MAG TPA: hypothetical protein VFX89_04280 [Gammaproteobacteria bacterium]|nr:hypothetical protein [Gammaproteobacteria bacterium]